MGVSSCDVIAGEGVGLHNGWCLETMYFVHFLLCCIQNTQNCAAKALVPVLNAPENWQNPPEHIPNRSLSMFADCWPPGALPFHIH